MKRFAVLAISAALITATAPAIPAVADGGAPIQLTAPMVTVKSTGGQMLKLLLTAGRSSSGTQVSVNLSHATSASIENHTWNFPVPSSAFGYTAPKGKLATGTHLGQYGAISLTFTKVSSTTQNCTGYSGKTKVVTTVVKFKGKVNFGARDTNAASKWGSVKEGSSTTPYTFGGKKGTYITESNGPCRVNFPTPKCFDEWSWSANGGSQTAEISLGGDSQTAGSTTTSRITGFAGRPLPAPTGASRLDTVTVRAPAPQFDGSANPNTLHASTTSGTSASGGGTLTATGNASSVPGGQCKRSDGTTTTQNASQWNAMWKNDATPLTVRMDVGSSISIGDGSGGYFAHLTFS